MSMNAFCAPAHRDHRNGWLKTSASIGFLSILLVPSAHADLFGSQAKSSQDSNPNSVAAAQIISARMERLEQEIRELKERATVPPQMPPGVQLPPGVPMPPGMLNVPIPGQDGPTQVEDYDLTYVKLGDVDGKVLVRSGSRRLVMSAAQYDAFQQKESMKAAAKREAQGKNGSGGPAATPGLPEAPPQPGVPVPGQPSAGAPGQPQPAGANPVPNPAMPQSVTK